MSLSRLNPLLSVEADDKEGDSVVGQGLPGLDKVHLGLQEVQVFDVGLGLKDPLPELENTGKISFPA